MNRVTVTKKRNERYYLGMDASAAIALICIVRCAFRNDWHSDLEGIQEAGEKVSRAVEQLREKVSEIDDLHEQNQVPQG